MFQATMCSSSGETAISMQHLVLVTRVDDWLVCRVLPAYQTVIHTEWQVPGVA